MFIEDFLGTVQRGKLSHVKLFSYATIHDNNSGEGNLLGEYLLSRGITAIRQNPYDYIGISEFFGQSLLAYPLNRWTKIIKSHPDYSGCQDCEFLLQEKLSYCSLLWSSYDFYIVTPGDGDDLKTQQSNLLRYYELGADEKPRLYNLSMNILFLSGMPEVGYDRKATFN